MKAYGLVGEVIYVSVSSGLASGKGLGSGTGRVIPGEGAPSTHYTGG
jgi:hypothetical protein